MKFRFRAAGLAAFVCFGGMAFAQADWTLKNPAHFPSKRLSPAMAQFGDGTLVVLFGGVNLGPTGVYTQFNILGDTWIWDGSDWSQINSLIGVTPPARFGASMAYDPVKGKVVMFGGVDVNERILGDTWLFGIQRICLHSNCTTVGQWQQLSFATGASPPGRRDASMAFDPIAGIVLTNGFNNKTYFQDTWVFSTSSFTWSNPSQVGGPNPGRSKTPMAQCAASGSTIPGDAMFFGGIGSADVALGDNWTFFFASEIGDLWSGVLPTAPGSRFGHGMAFYPVSGKDVLYGGNTGLTEIGQFLDSDTWNGSCFGAWSQASPLHNPGPRFLHGMTTGPSGLTLVMFGGSDVPQGGLYPNGRDRNDTWTWGRRAACLPGDGSEIRVGTRVTCQFDPAQGSTFGGWKAIGFAPPFQDGLTTTFHTESPGPATITAHWTDETGFHTATLNYTVKPPGQ